MDEIINTFFTHNDPILARLADLHGADLHIPDERPLTHFVSELCQTIVSQQLSVKAAATIWSRAKLLAENWDDPHSILKVEDTALRQAGLSCQKVSYVKNIARGVIDGTLNPARYSAMKEEDIIEELVKIKGIGLWTAEMFLIFALGRKDVFSHGDLGLRNAIKKHYGDLSSEQIVELSSSWSPYRSYASLLLWKSLDNEPKKS